MKTLLVFLIALLPALTVFAQSQPPYPGKTWSIVKSPASLGWSAEKLKLAQAYSLSIGSAAVMIIDNGEIVDQWGETTRKYNTQSLWKPFLNALYGMAVRDGRINIQNTLADSNADDKPGLTPQEKQARLADLLEARSGVYHPSNADTPAMINEKPQRDAHKPGEFWLYQNWDFCAAGGIYEQLMGASLFKEFGRLIAEPIGMEDFGLDDTQYLRGDKSIYPWYIFRMSARDLARFGLLYLRQGRWNDKQIIPQKWIEESLKPYSDASLWERGGYGRLWWVTLNNRLFKNVKAGNNAFAGTGIGGHYLVMIPDLDLIVVHRTNADFTRNGMEGVMIGDEQFGALLNLILDAKRPK